MKTLMRARRCRGTARTACWTLRAVKVVACLLAALATGCGAPTGGPAPELEALVVSMTDEAWNRGELGVFSTAMADTVRFHYAGTPRTLTREQMGAAVTRWRSAFPDLRMEIDELVAEEDLVAGRFTLSGTHEGTWNGVAPTGRRVTMALMMFFRFNDGEVVELWESDDQLGLRRQLGALR